MARHWLVHFEYSCCWYPCAPADPTHSEVYDSALLYITKLSPLMHNVADIVSVLQ